MSLVLNDHASGRHIPSETRRRVLEVARRLGYAADPAARSLAGGRNFLLGVFSWEPVFPMDHRDFYYPFLLGIEEEAEASGYDLVLFTSASGESRRRSIYRSGSNRLWLADGCILLGLEHDRAELRRLAGEGLSLVHIGRREMPDLDLPFVSADYAAATAAVVDRLLSLGHRHFLYVGAPDPEEPQVDRSQGFDLACRRAGLPAAAAACVRLPKEKITAGWVRRAVQEGCTAFVVEDVQGARALVESAAALHLAIPADLSVAVLVDLPSPDDREPPWFGFRVPRAEMGRQAVRLLVQRLVGDLDSAEAHVSVSCELMEGWTVGAPPDRGG